MGTEAGKENISIRLCVVSPLYHPSLGGLGRQAQLLTERLAENGVDLFVIARRMKGMPPALFSNKLKAYRAWSIKPYHHLYEKIGPVNILVSMTFSISCALLLILKRKDYDIVHFHGSSIPLWFNLLLLKILRKRVIAKVAAANLGIEPGALRGRHFGLGNLIIKLLQKVDLFVAISSEIEKGLLSDGFPASKIRRVPNFVDFHVFSPPSSNERKVIKSGMGLNRHIIITFSGRFIKRKGIDILLKAFKAILSDFNDLKLILLGEGPLLSDMKLLAREAGIAGSVDFRGHVNKIKDFLYITDIFVLPSFQEGMPNSLLEAMACGLPVVATKIGGVEDIIEDGKNGILVRPGDPNDLTKGIKTLLDNKELRDNIASNAFKTIRERYSLDNIACKYVELYKEVLMN